MLFLRTNSPNWTQSHRLFRASPGFGRSKYFMTRVYRVIHEEPYHQMTSKLRFELALPSLQHSLDGNKLAHKIVSE